jgi:hypothetical protein
MNGVFYAVRAKGFLVGQDYNLVSFKGDLVQLRIREQRSQRGS